MNSPERMESDDPALSGEYWQKVGGFMREATIETAQELGGQDLALKVISLSGDPNQLIPDASGLAYLETNFPGAAELVMGRAEHIQEMRNKHEKEK